MGYSEDSTETTLPAILPTHIELILHLTVKQIETPSLKRRVASMLYESILVFAVLFAAIWIFSTLMEQRHALYLRSALQDWLFLVLGIYFVWFWTHGGQTLAMKTWKIRVTDIDGKPVKVWRAIARYLFAWLSILPGLALAWLVEAQEGMLILIPLANVAIWVVATCLDSERQFLHDRLAGTRLTATDEHLENISPSR